MPASRLWFLVLLTGLALGCASGNVGTPDDDDDNDDDGASDGDTDGDEDSDSGVDTGDAPTDPDTWPATDGTDDTTSASDDATESETGSASDSASDDPTDDDTESASETITDTGDPWDSDTGPATCAGVRVGPGCWYFGAAGKSCTQVCSTHGGYDDVTRDYAGSWGMIEYCGEVLDALGAPGGNVGNLSGVGGVGCAVMEMTEERYWVSSVETVAGEADSFFQRACACNG